MKRFSSTIVTLFAFSIFTLNCAIAGAEEIKIGYINLGKTLDEYEKTQESEKSLEKKLDKKVLLVKYIRNF